MFQKAKKDGRVKAMVHEMGNQRPKPEIKKRMFGPYNVNNWDLARRMRIFDRHGGWLRRWDEWFGQLDIRYLRSHKMLHPDPVDRDAIQIWAEHHNRANELFELKHLQRTRTFHGPFDVPSTPLFHDMCSHQVKRYKLESSVERAEVTLVEPMWEDGAGPEREAGGGGPPDPNAWADGGVPGWRPPDYFKVHYSGGGEVLTRRVVLALGSTNRPQVPEWVGAIDTEYPADRIAHVGELVERSCAHTADMAIDPMQSAADGVNQTLFTPAGKGEVLVIVGGGLTSAQLVPKALELGYSHVKLLVRKPVLVKQFDIDNSWISHERNDLLAKFWSEPDFSVRRDILREARGGGSITPEGMMGMEAPLASGLASIEEGTEVWEARWEHDPSPEGAGKMRWQLTVSNRDDEIACDRIWLATGSVLDVTQEPIFAEMNRLCPISIHGGLPAVTQQLQWGKGCQLYVMGIYAALQLGPDALNLAGARSGSVRITDGLQRHFNGTGAGEGTRFFDPDACNH
mmetsp:Transcript_38056/g.120133  ORF Transcript_38056/g.120133 Transcript_38056/m.120133 type:complete len:513 (+) Transcript_38056:296-1834(+)